MIEEKKISKLIKDHLGESDKFLVEVTVKSGNNIDVILDGDNGVKISDCVAMSRHIESNLDREIEDFNLRVLSAGIGQPYKLKRQYRKNIGQLVKVIMLDGKEIKGTLVKVAEKEIVIDVKQKKKQKAIEGELNEITLLFDEIKETKEIVTFK